MQKSKKKKWRLPCPEHSLTLSMKESKQGEDPTGIARQRQEPPSKTEKSLSQTDRNHQQKAEMSV